MTQDEVNHEQASSNHTGTMDLRSGDDKMELQVKMEIEASKIV